MRQRPAPKRSSSEPGRRSARRTPPAPAPRATAPTLSPVGVAACLLLAAPAGFATPQGAVLVSGQATVRQTAPGQMDIQQTTPRAQLDWTSFSIAAGERVNVVQPDRSSVLLNRVLGDNPSLIYGSLSSNGSVWLINPRGIVFGAGSRVDVGSLVASTLELSQQDLASGRIQLGAGAGGAGELRSEGTINAADRVVLVAPQLMHSGQINARRVGLAAASEVLVDVEGDGLIFFNVRNDRLDAKLSVLGSVRADGGTAEIRAAARAGFADTVLNMDGIVQARGLGQQQGRIIVDGGSSGVTRVAGTLDTSAAGETRDGRGGQITVLGEQVQLAGSARLDASGPAGGGLIRVGGDYQGRNPELHNARTTTVSEGAQLNADATVRGDGGRVIVWSDDTTHFDGRISARGGLQGGDGGFVETSGKLQLGVNRGSVSVAADAGRGGTWLLDPATINVITGGLAPYADVNSAGAQPGTTQNVDPVTLVGVGGNVILDATSTINVNSDLALTVAGATLTLQAGIGINVNANVSTNNGAISFSSGTGGFTLASGKTIDAGSATISIDANSGSVTLSGALATTNNTASAIRIEDAVNVQLGNVATGGSAGQITLLFSGTGTQAVGSSISAGKVLKDGTGTLVLSRANGYTGGTQVDNGTLRIDGSGASAGSGTIDIGNKTLDVVNGASVGNDVLLVDGATLLSSAGTGTLSTGSDLVLGNNDTLNLSSTGGGTLVVSRVIDGSANGIDVVVTGTGVVSLTANNTYDGGTQVNGGTLRIDGATASAGSGSITLGNRTLDIAGGATVTNNLSVTPGATILSSGTGGGTFDRALNLGANGALNLASDSGGRLVIANVLSDGGADNATVTVTGGTVALQGANTYGGDTTVSGGTLQIDGASGRAGNAGTIQLGARTLDIVGGASVATTIAAASGATIRSSTGGGTLAAGTLTLANGAALNLAGGAASTLTVARVIPAVPTGATESVNVTGGTVVLTGTNTYAGNTDILNGATLVLGAGGTAGSLASGNTVSIDTGGTLRINRSDSVTLAGTISGAGTLEQFGGGTTILTATNNSYGATTLSGGVLQVGNGGAGGTLGSGAITLGAATTLRVDRTGTLTLAGTNVISGTGTFDQHGSGTTVLTADSSAAFSGAVSVTGGTLRVSGTTANAGTGTIALGTVGQLDIAGDATVTNTITAGTGAVISASGSNGGTLGAGTLDLAAGARLDLSASGAGALKVTRVITDANDDGQLRITAGTVSLQSANTYGGNTTVTGGGTLQISGSGTAGNGGSIGLGANTLDIAGGASVSTTITASSGATITSSTGGGTLAAGTLTLADGATLNLAGGAGSTLTVARAITDVAGGTDEAVSVTGGTVVLTGANTYTGNTDITGGATLVLGANGTTGSLAAGNTVSIGSLATLRVNRSDAVTLSGALSGLGTFEQAGGGTTILTATNTHGATTVSGGVLQVGNGGAAGTLGSGPVALNAGTLRIDRSGTLTLAGSLSGAGTLDQHGSGTTILTAANAGFSGAIDITGGTLRISGASAGAGSGAIAVGANTLDIAGGASIDNDLSVAGGLITSSTGGGTLAAGTAVNLGDGGSVRLSSAGGGTLAIARVLADGGANDATVTIDSGTVALRGANTYGGNTTVTAGTLQIGGSGTAGNAGSIVLGANTLDITGGASVSTTITVSSGATIRSSTGGGTLAAGTLTLADGATLNLAGGAGSTLTVARAITDVAGGSDEAVSVTGGTVVLTGTNTYTGDTDITGAATLVLGANGTTGSLAAGNTVNIGSGATLRVNRSDSVTLSGALNGLGTLEQAGGGTTILTATNNHGATTVSGGVLQVGNGGTAGTLGSGTVALNAGTLRIDRSDTVTLSNTFSGSGTLEQHGGGTLVLTGDSDPGFSGAVDITGGTLRISGATANAGTGAIAIGANTLDIANGASVGNAITVAGGLITSSAGGGTLASGTAINLGNGGSVRFSSAGGGTLAIARVLADGGANDATVTIDSGTVALRAANTYGGDTTVSGGTLQIDGGTAGNAGSIVLGANTLDIVGGSSVASTVTATNGATIRSSSGGGTLAAGTLTLADGATLNLAGAAGSTLNVARAIAATAGAGVESVNATGGTVVLGGANTYTGDTTVSAGTLRISGATATAGSGGSIVLGANTLDIANGASVGNTVTVSDGATITSSTGGGTLGTGGTLNLGAGVGLTLASAGGGTLTVARVISDSNDDGALTINGGIVALQAVNTHGGDTTVSAGTLRIDGGTAGDGRILLNANTLDIVNAGSVAADVVAGNGATLSSSTGNGTLAAGALTLADGATLNLAGGAASTLTVARAIPAAAGAGLENIAVGSGTVVLGAANTYGGSTSIASGATLVVGNGTTAGSIGSGSVAIASGGTLRVDRSDTVTLANVFSGSGSLDQHGSGTTVLTADSSAGFSGAVGVTGGTLRLQGATAQAGTGTITLGANTLDIAGGASVANTLVASNGASVTSSSGGGTLAAGTLTLADGSTLNLSGGAGSTLTVARAIPATAGAGTESLAIAGGTVVLTGTNTYGGSTTLAGGATLAVGAGGTAGTLGSGAVTLAAGTTLRVDRSDTLTLGNVLSGSGSFDQHGSGTTVLTADSSAAFSGAVDISGGTLRLAGATARAGTGTLTLGTHTLDITGGASVTNTVVAASGATVSSSSGNGTLAAGTLTLADGATLNLAGGAGSTLNVARTIAAVGGGAEESVNIAGGTVVLGSAHGYAGGTTVAAGATLRLAGATADAGSGTLALGSGTLDITGGANVTNTLTVADGATVRSSSGGGTLDAGTLTLGNGVGLTLAGAAGSTLTIARSIHDSAANGRVTASGGTVLLTADNSWQGLTTINSGATLVAGAGGAAGSIGSGSVTNNGVLRINRDNSATVTLGAAIGGSGSLEQVGGGTTVLAADNSFGDTVVSAGVLQVGTGGNTGTLGLGSITVDNPGALRFNRAGTLTVPGSITGSGRLELAGSGVAELVSSGLYTGGTSILSGTLRIVGAGASAGTGTIAVGSGTLDITGGAIVNNLVTIADGGTIANSSGSGTLATHATALTLAGGSTLNLSSTGTGLSIQRVISDGAGTASVLVNGSGAGQVTLTAANTYDGSTRVASGTLAAGADGVLAGSSTLVVDGGQFDIGTRNIGVAGVSLRSGSITGSSGVLSSSTDHDLRAGTVSAILGGAVGLVKSTAGTVTISGSQAYTGATTVSGGTLALGSDNVLANAGTVNVGGAGTLDLGTHVDTVGTLSLQGLLAGSGTLTATSYTLAGATVNGNLGTGTITSTGSVQLNGTAAASTVNVDGGTLTLGGAERLANGATLRVQGPATLALGGAETVGTLELSGGLSGSGTLTAASYTLSGGHTDLGANLGTGTLSASGTSTLGGTAAAGTVTVTGGTLLLDGAQRLASGATVNVNAGTLQLAGAQDLQTLNLSGTLAGSGRTLTVSDHATLNTGADVQANLAGARADVAGNTTLGGTTSVAALNVNAGRLTLGSAGRLGAGTAVAVAGAGDLRLAGDETVTSLALTGALSGSGTLSAGSYTFNTGANTAAGANLGTGTLTVTGDSTLAGSTAAGLVNINGGTLALVDADRLAAGAIVNVNAGALQLGGAQTVQTLNLSGTLAGAGQTLTTSDRATLNTGASVLANLAGPRLDVAGNASLSGTAAATAVNVNGGRLTLGSAGRLAGGATVTVAGGAELALGGNETVTRVDSAGTLSGGTATLTAANVVLREGAVVSTRLGTGQLDVEAGDTLGATLGATSAAATVNVNSGTLRFTQGNLLDDNAAVTVAAGATLTLNGNDTIGSLAVAGTVNGIGAFNAGSFLLTGGQYELDIASGAIVSTGNSRLIGSVGAGSVTVQNGVLTLGSAGRFTNAPSVNILGAGTLNLNGDETFGALLGSGTLDLRGATLTTGSRGDSSFSGNLVSSSGAGGLVKVGSSAFSFSGSGSYTGLTRVDDGVFNVAGTLASSTLQVNGTATLNVLGDNRLADGAAASVGSAATLSFDGSDRIGTLALQGRLGGNGTLSATSFTLTGGTVDANLGSGQLHSSGNSRLNGQAAVDAVSVDGGTLLLAGSQQFSALPAVTVATGATLQLGTGDQTLGSLAGSGSVALGAQTLATGGGGSSVFAGVIGGSGGLVKQGSSSFTLAGSQTYTGSTRVSGGTLVLAAADRLADSGALVVDSGATLELRGDEQVGSLALSGQLIGSGHTLTAASYGLDGGTVDAQLGAGVLTSRGASTINGTAAAGNVTVESGTLTLAGSNRLSALPALTVAGGATLQLAGAQALGTLAGDGTVDIAAHTLTTGSGGDSRFGGTITGSGNLSKVGTSTFTLDGTSSAANVIVDAGTLALGAAERLADSSAVNVGGGATLRLAGDERIGNLVLAGTLAGTGTLSATSYELLAGRVEAGIGQGQLTSRGSSTIAASVDAAVDVADGTLTLSGSNRLGDGVAVNVQGGATLTLDGTDTVASLRVQGTVAGIGTLSAATTTLDNGLVTANLGAGSLVSRGTSTLSGRSAATDVSVQDGTLTLAGADRLSALPAVQVAGGAVLAFGGDQTFGTLAGSGDVALGAFTLATGSGGSSTFAGAIGGSGGLIKQGSSSTFTLTGANTYGGLTRVSAGTLRVGDGATAGSLSGSRFEVDGLLSFARSDTVQLTQEVSGSGGIEQAGSGRLVFSGGNKRHSGVTRVASGELATTGSGDLSGTSTVEVAAGGRLLLAGSESVRGIDADGTVTLQAAGASLGATDSLLMRGAVTSSGDAALSAGQRLLADSAGNRFGGTLALQAGGRIDLSSGVENGSTRALTLGALNAGGGGHIEAGATTFAADANVTGGTLELVSDAAQGAVSAETGSGSGRQITGLPIAFAADGVMQGDSGRISVAAGAGLSITTRNGASVQLLRSGNSFLGDLSVVTGAPNVAWTPNSTNVSIGGGAPQNYAVQSRVRIEGGTVNVGGDGIVADVVNIRADRLATVGDSATIVARMPFDATVGTAVSMPAMTLELTPESFSQSFPFGSAGQGLRVNVGAQSYGGRTLPLDAGYITVLPRNGAQGSTAVLLTGPAVGGYRFFFAGAGVQGEIPVFYNGVLPTTPQVQNSISATLAVSEGARKDRFEEAVRTENVAVRLRGGVIAEVGPAPSATQGTDGIRVPSACTPAAGLLQCGAP